VRGPYILHLLILLGPGVGDQGDVPPDGRPFPRADEPRETLPRDNVIIWSNVARVATKQSPCVQESDSAALLFVLRVLRLWPHETREASHFELSGDPVGCLTLGSEFFLRWPPFPPPPTLGGPDILAG
jgi:hypothetical protein